MSKGDGFSGRQFDRTFPRPVGRITRAWGVPQKRLREQRAAIVQELADHGQEEVLLAFKRRRFGWNDLLRAKRQGRIASAGLALDLTLDRPLWDHRQGRKHVEGAVTATLALMGGTDSSRARYGVAFDSLRHAGGDFLPDAAPVSALCELSSDDWNVLWAELAHLSASSRNRVRSAVSRFLSIYLADKYHPTRRAVMRAMGPFEEEGDGTVRTVTVDEFWTLMAAIPTDEREVVEPCYVTLAATGMRVGEYLQCGADDLRRFPTIHIPGGKTGAADVQVAAELEPIVRAAIPCTLAGPPAAWLAGECPYPGVQHDARYKVLHRVMAAASKATGIPCSPHYLRHLFGALAVQGTNQVDAQHALRHKTPGMTAHYARQKTNQAVGEAVGAALLHAQTSQKSPAKSTGPGTGRARKPAQTKRGQTPSEHHEND